MSATDAGTIQRLEQMKGNMAACRGQIYQYGGPASIVFTNLMGIDKLLADMEAIIDDLRKMHAVEGEATAYDIAMRTSVDGTPRAPDGRDYHELFAILSPTPRKEKV